MKSAYELAMERLGGETKYTEEQKELLAEIDRKYDAKIAELKIRADEEAKKNPESVAANDSAQHDLRHEVARLEEKREAEKDKIRKA